MLLSQEVVVGQHNMMVINQATRESKIKFQQSDNRLLWGYSHGHYKYLVFSFMVCLMFQILLLTDQLVQHLHILITSHRIWDELRH